MCDPKKVNMKWYSIKSGSQEMEGKNFNNDNLEEETQMQFLKFVLLTYHHSHFLAAILDFTSFFIMTFLEGGHLFFSLAVLD